MMHRGLVFAGGLIVLAGPASAADYSPVMYSSYPISGYVDLHGGWDGGSYSTIDDCCGPNNGAWNGAVFGGAGSVAIGLSPNMSVQADAWTNVWTGSGSGYQGGAYTYEYTNTYSGIAGHISWRPVEADLVGVFASVGNMADSGAFSTIGVEAVHNFNNLRFYGQFGMSGALNGSAADDSARDWYTEGVMTFYFTPNFRLSGDLGYDAASDKRDFGTVIDTRRWGARIEYKPDSMPVSGFLAYAGASLNGSNHNTGRWSNTENAVVAGIRILFDSNGNATLRQLDNSVGLSDMNHSYGVSFDH